MQTASSATAVVGDTETYAKWFGTYSEQNAEQVRAVLKQVLPSSSASAWR